MPNITNKLCVGCNEYHGNCETCGKHIDNCHSNKCFNCRIIENRIEKYLQSKKGLQKIKKYLKDKKEEKYSGIPARFEK